jgi:hypothetical protein
MRIQAITVCVDYADFLDCTLPHTMAAADEVLVVTSPDDNRTLRVATAHGVPVLRTTAMYDDGRRFSLGAAINAGLRTWHPQDWVLVVDADIVLPPKTHRTLDHAGLDKFKLYGADRVHCRGWAAAASFSTEARVVCAAEVPFFRDFPVGARIALPDHGYVPCGYFQLWHAGATGYRDYPIHPGGTAQGSDMLHAMRFPRQYRELIPELVCIQLETDTAADPVGVNWAGRRTAEFSAEGGAYRR